MTLNSVDLVGTSTMTVGSAGHTATVIIGNGGQAASANSNLDVAFGTLANGGGLATFALQCNSTTVEAGARLDMRDLNLEVSDLSGAGSITTGTKASTVLTLDVGSFGGVISGAGHLVVAGSVMQLTGANTYTGGTTITPSGDLNIGDGVTGGIVGNVVDNGMLTFQIARSTFAGAISGTGSVRTVSGALTLSGNNTYQGGTDILGGVLTITNANALGANTGGVTVEDGAELSATGTVALAHTVNVANHGTLSSTGTFTVNSLELGTTSQLKIGSTGHAGTIVLAQGGSAEVSPSSVIEVAFGTLANGGNMSFFTRNASSTTVDAGATLDLRDGSIEIAHLIGEGKVRLGTQASTTLTLDAAGFNGVISGAGQLIDNGNVTLTGANTYTGGTQAGNLHIGSGGTAGSIVGNVTINGTLTVDRSNAFAMAGILSGGGALVKQGTGLLTLTGNNSFVGGTTIQDGAISMGNGNALGTGSVTLDSGTELTTTGNFTLPNTIATTSGSATISTTGTLTLGSLALSAPVIFGSAGHTGTVVVSKTGTFNGVASGTIDVAFGTLRDGNSLGTFTNFVNSTTVEAPATLDFNDQSAGIKNLLGAGKVKLGVNSATTLTLSAGNFSGIISGAGHLTIAGNTTLAGASTYTGGTSLTSGVTTVKNASGSATGTGVVVISSGASLGGTGHITGAVTLNSGGVIQPGQNTGAGSALHLGSLLWNGGGTLDFDIGSVGDEVALGGALTKGSAGQFTLDILNAGIGLTPHNFTLMTFTSTTFSLSDFQLELPANVTGTLVLTATSLQLQNLHDPPADRPLASDFAETGSIADATGPSSLPTDTSADSVPSTSSESFVAAPTPEPTSVLLLACGTLPILARRRRK